MALAFATIRMLLPAPVALAEPVVLVREVRAEAAGLAASAEPPRAGQAGVVAQVASAARSWEVREVRAEAAA